eukprot:sb/3473574/
MAELWPNKMKILRRRVNFYRLPCVLKISIPGNLTTEIAGEGVFPGTVSVHEDLSVGQGFLYEFIGTLVLVITVLATINGARGQGSNYLQPLSIGLAIFVIHLVVGMYNILSYLTVFPSPRLLSLDLGSTLPVLLPPTCSARMVSEEISL